MAPPSSTPRVEGIDVARAVAGLMMIQGHAFHGWASPEARETAGYAVTRLLGTLPLPAFLVLSGAAVALRVGTAAARGEQAAVVRRKVSVRGLEVVAWGYAVNLAFAAMDGFSGLDTLLRVDVLHVIGLSIAAVSWLGIRSSARSGPAPDVAKLRTAALWVGIGGTIVCPWLTEMAGAVTGHARYVVALFGDVPGVTRMPLVPLVSWLCLGIGAGQWMMKEKARASDSSPSGAPAGALLRMGAAGMVLAVTGWLSTRVVVEVMQVPLTRAHPVVWLNVIDLGGRGLVVLAAGAALASHVRGPVRSALLRFGRGSLVAYVFHIPFCYGALGAPFIHRLDMISATLLVTCLVTLSYLAVHLRDVARHRSLSFPTSRRG